MSPPRTRSDYKNYKLKRLETQKLATRHPLDPFWASQLQMVPLVLYNQVRTISRGSASSSRQSSQ